MPKLVSFGYKNYDLVNKKRISVCKSRSSNITDGDATTSNFVRHLKLHKEGCPVYFAVLILLMVSVYYIGEVVKRSRERPRLVNEVFDPHKNNENCTSFHSRDCTPMPIDLVYTWVNGSDETLVMDLIEARQQLAEEERSLREEPECTLSHCIAAPVLVLNPALPAGVTVNDLPSLSPSLSEAVALLQLNQPLHPVSAVVFHSRSDAEKALAGVLNEGKKIFSVSKGYLTTDKELPGLIRMQTLAYLGGFSPKVSENLQAKLPAAISDKITELELYPQDHIALLHFKSPQHLTDLLQEDTLMLDGEKLAISPVYLFWDLSGIIKFLQTQSILTKSEKRSSLSANRFEDNDALRHSLRSVEKYVPWVRHIFIVTNGQIPSWLNLENPRVSIVTHKEIFLNHSHLPTFNSVAIESNLHRIPGISQKFMYLNDDMMFGKEVWLDDFYTPSSGQKIYLTWALGPCSKACRGVWINNGQCNEGCNNIDCLWDGGDCKAKKHRSARSAGTEKTNRNTGGTLLRAGTSQTVTPESPLIFSNEDKSGPKVEVFDAAAIPLARKLQQFVPSNEDVLLWQMKKDFIDLLEEDEHQQRGLMYETNGAATGRKLQDSFLASLNYVDRLYNSKFGTMTRRVIAHTPYMIDKLIMKELQDTFPKEFKLTSSHHLRHTDDMQFSFSYFYFLMSVKQQTNIADFFDIVDQDHSGVLSDSEIEALAKTIYKQPLKPMDLTDLGNELLTCSKTFSNEVMQIHTVKFSPEVYHDQNMPQITKYVFLNCKPVTDRFREAIKRQNKYKYTIMGEQEIHFRLIKNDNDRNKILFKDVLNNAKKFICLNDDIDRSKSNAKAVEAMLAQFYHDILPHPSQFELPKSKTNKFLKVDKMQEWETYQDTLKFYRFCAIVVLIIFSFKFIFKTMICLKQKLLHGGKEFKKLDKM
ncbi:N-acetylglucosamine-1-phosphotransferase subunits alpha/beta-like isoform X2 [Entelurus aequoreus]|uniref:N-acetylglucosamine-1-phosphotransferase subunits alpha/beta-like isoform X2 n=1 Tax=Entelurus aequoreus TaxID=161455 RepID=UPI002B1DAC43|nr:N-acetylglucosamine-1-phosphotransferase subunits alpha/beta-like isoform X2 [Entelurus aequoreus]